MKSIAVFLPEGFADWEAAFLLAAGRSFFGMNVRTFSLAGDCVRSIGGLAVSVDGAVKTLRPDQFDLLALIGSDIWASKGAPNLSGQLGEFMDANKRVAAICGATLALARAGFLDARQHTSNSLEFLQTNASGYKGESLYQSLPVAVSDSGVITAPGSAPVSFAAEIFRTLLPDMEQQIASFQDLCAREHLYHLQQKESS